MKNDIIIDPIVQNFINDYIDRKLYDVFIFGSRAKLNNKVNSDRDLGIISKNNQKIGFDEYTYLSGIAYDLPIKVDILDFGRVDFEFAKMNQKDRIYI